MPLEEKGLSDCPWAIQNRSPVSTKVGQAFESEEQLSLQKVSRRSGKQSRRPPRTHPGFRAGAQTSPPMAEEETGSASESLLSSLWGSALSLVSAQPVQGSGVVPAGHGDIFAHGHCSLDLACPSGCGKCSAVLHIQI